MPPQKCSHYDSLRSKEMKLAKVFVPAFAMMTMALSSLPARADQKVRIGVTMASFGHTFHITMMDGMKKWAQAHPDVELSMVDASDASAKQTGQVENFLAQGMDGVVVQPVDPAATGPISKGVLKAGKALVYLNRKPDKLPNGVVFCGSNSIDSGIMNMEELGKCMGGKGNVVILMGELSNEATRARTDGIKKVIKEKFPDIKVIREQTANWNVNAAYLLAKKEPNPKVADGNILIPYQPVTKENYKSFMK